METIINTIFEKITTIPSTDPIFIYTAVGAAAGTLNANKMLELENYQQYPPFLQDLINKVPNMNLFIILIDPAQEEPPYMVNDQELNLHLSKNTISDNKIEPVLLNRPHLSYYNSDENHLHVFTYRQDIFTDPYRVLINGINITSYLRELNVYAIKNHITTLYHDFTGRQNRLLAEYFDKEIDEALDHIIYGMSVREDYGCYFDLTEPICYFPFQLSMPIINKRPIIKLFNIFKYITLNTISEKLKYQYNFYPRHMHHMIDLQKTQVIHSIKNEFKNNYFANLRIIKKIMNKEEEPVNINNLHFLEKLTKSEQTIVINLYCDEKYSELFEYLITHYSKYIELILKFTEINMGGREILNLVTNNINIYDWYSYLDRYLKMVIVI
jgi:hypothetical protein